MATETMVTRCLRPLMGFQRRARAEMALDASAEVAAGSSARCDAANPLAALKKRLLRDWGRPHCTVFLSVGATRRVALHTMGLESGHEIRLAICKQEAVPAGLPAAQCLACLRPAMRAFTGGFMHLPGPASAKPNASGSQPPGKTFAPVARSSLPARQRRCACKIEVRATSPQTPVSERCRAATGKPKHSYPRLL